MTAYQIYCELKKVGGWANESRKVLWLAARYYSGADSYETLKSHAERLPTGNGMMPALLPPGKVAMIRDLR